MSSIPEKPRGRSSSTPWEHKVSIQPGENDKVPPWPPKKKEGTKEGHGTDPRRRLETQLGHQTIFSAQIKSKAVSSTEISVKRAFWKAKVIPLLIFPPKDLQCLKKNQPKNPTNKPQTKAHFAQINSRGLPHKGGTESGAEN